MVLERDYQQYLIRTLKELFPGCVVLKNDPEYIQGFPDLLVLYGNKWAALEVKASRKSAERPNQAYYVEQLDYMSFAAFIYPENEEDVLNALQQTFKSRRTARISRSQQVPLD